MKLLRFLPLIGLLLLLVRPGSPTLAASLPPLGSAASFAVLGGSTVTSMGFTQVVGDVGVSPGTAISGWGPGTLTGSLHAGDPVAVQAQADAAIAYNNAAGQACQTILSGQDLGGLTLPAASYCFSSSAQLTGHLILDGGGDPNSIFVFQIGSTLITSVGAQVTLINQAQACNIFWQVGSSATLGTGAQFQGNVLAYTSITLNTGASNMGGLYALNGAVTLDTNQVQACGPPPTPTSTPVAGCQPVSWINGVNVTADNNTLTKSGGGNAWNAGATSSLRSSAPTAYMQATLVSTTTTAMFGLSNGDPDPGNTHIAFAFYPYPGDHKLYVVENGTSRGAVSNSYAVGDVLTVLRQNNHISYYQNGTLVYTSTVTPAGELLVDSSIFTPGGQVAQAMFCAGAFQPVPTATPTSTVVPTATATASPTATSTPVAGCQSVSWINSVNATSNNNTLTKSGGGNAWNAGGTSSLRSSAATAYMQATLVSTTTSAMFGLSQGDSDQNYTDIDFAFYPNPGDHKLYVSESGTSHGPVSNSYAVGDVLLVLRQNNHISYYQNGALVYTSTVTPAGALLVDSSIFTPGGQVALTTFCAGAFQPVPAWTPTATPTPQ